MIRNVVIITGGVSRVGKLITEFFASQGYDVLLTYHKSEDQFYKIKNELEGKYNVKLYGFKVNFLDQIEVLHFFSLFADFIDSKRDDHVFYALFNNASIFFESSFSDTNFIDIENFFTIHVSIPMNLIRMFNNYCNMARQTNHIIVNFSDAMVLKHEKYINKYFFYTLSKKFLYSSSSFIRSKLNPNVSLINILPKKIMDNKGNLISYELYSILNDISSNNFDRINDDTII